jgi:bifunctional non-homologous end joining protein LigD
MGKSSAMTGPPLADYRRKRRPGATPEPIPDDAGAAPAPSDRGPRFVIQEHHASSLHWDFRLERDGVLVSWALPKGLPVTRDDNHLAVHVEDHPLEYRTFSGTIPSGQYGGGTVSIWDQGTYTCEKWSDHEVMVVLHGHRTEGRFVLFPTRDKNWMIHRMDPTPDGYEPLPKELAPMLAVAGSLPTGKGPWAYEFKWDGIRALVWVDGGRARAASRTGRDITASFPELRDLGEALGSTRVVLDGEIVVLDPDGRPSFSRLQHRMHVTSSRNVARAASTDPASLVVFDLLHLDGRSLLGATYDERRSQLDQLGIGGPSWAVTPSFTTEAGADVLRTAHELGMEGVVAKRRDSTYHPGLRSADWVKVKDQRTQEVVIGGWTAGQGNRRSTFGALLLGLPSPGRRTLTFVGKVGTGFTDVARDQLLAELRPLMRATSPFDEDLPKALATGAHWVRPRVVGEVRFTEWTTDGRFRHPVWRGLRPDKKAGEVHRES